MKLALVLPATKALQPPANLRYWTFLIAALERSGVSVALHRPRLRLIYAPGARGRRPPLFGLVGPWFLRALVRGRPDAVLALEFGSHTALSVVAGRLTRTPVLIFQEHGGVGSRPLTRSRRRYRRLLARLANGVVANTGRARGSLERDVGVDPAKIVDVPLLVAPERDSLCRIEPELPAIATRPLFVYAGRLIPQKNAGALLAAAALLRAEGAAFSVWVVGDGPERASLERRSADLGLQGTVEFLGSVPYPGIGHVLAACDVFVMPTLRDYRSVAVLEALRFGKPVIDSVHDGNAHDSIEEGVNGLVVDPADPASLGGAMRRFVDEPALARAMGARAARTLDRSTPEAAAETLRRVLLDVRSCASRSSAPVGAHEGRHGPTR